MGSIRRMSNHPSQRHSYGLNRTWRSTLKIQFQFGRVLFALAGRRLTGNVSAKDKISMGAISDDSRVNTVRIEKWDEALRRQDVYRSLAVFRGQTNSKWDLTPSFIRELKRLEKTESWLSSEAYLIDEFRRRGHLYVETMPKKEDRLGHLILMQHHGAPTRLLDFTYSFYIACFFAFCAAQPDTESVVWVVDDAWLRLGSTKSTGSNNWNHALRGEQLAAQYRRGNEILNELHSKFKGGGGERNRLDSRVLMIEPEQQIERLGIQQGLFLMPVELNCSFLENLIGNCSEFDDSDPPDYRIPNKVITKLVFSKSARNTGFRELGKMNVSAESLFPGMDGFCRSLSHFVL